MSTVPMSDPGLKTGGAAGINPTAPGGVTVGSTLPATPTTGTQAAAGNPFVPPTAPSATGLMGNTTATPITVPTTSSTGAPLTTTGISSGLSTTNGDNTLAGDFTQTYGQGTGTALVNTLAGLGTSTDAAVQATMAAANQNATKGLADIDARNAAAGLSKDSSASALGTGDFLSTVQSNLNQTISGMELQQQQELISSLFQEGGAHGGDSSWLQSLGDIANFGAGLAGTFTGAALGTSGGGA